ncbi:MAG: OmpA family protein [Rubrivivax sp.]
MTALPRVGIVHAVVALLALLAWTRVVAAGAELDTRTIIEALRLPAAGAEAPRTRNLAVVARGPADLLPAAAAAPALAEATQEAERPAVPPPSLSLALTFASNSAELRPENGRVLGQLVAAMLSPELRGQRFLIEGHSDARGVAVANQRLSLERAEEVRQYLVALGVPAGRLRAAGRGAQMPANPADPAAAENRRVRVVALP